ncbi:MAG TPA: HlyD family secretion protein [Rhodanobacteraceae bacterium]|nr:HlyD family secretion protein [Rhodanobacteraceae bacterium]
MTDKQYGAPDVAASEQPKKRKPWQRTLWIAGPLVVVLIAAWFYLTAGRYVETENAYVGADQATIAPQVGGRVLAVVVHQNQHVHKGDVLFTLDPKPYQLAVDQLKAQMHAVGDYLAGTRDSYDAAIANLHSDQITLNLDLAQLKRMKDLHKRGLVAQKQVDDAAAAVAAARGDRDADRAAVSKAKNMLGGSPDAGVQTMAGYKAIEAQMAKAQLDLSHTVVRAPIDGTIGEETLQPGDVLQAGEPAMPLVGDELWVDANFKETDLTHVTVGDPATISVDTYPDHEWKAHVASISPASGSTFSLLPAQNATGNWVKIVQRIPVRLKFDEPVDGPRQLRVGMSAEVSIDTGAENSIWGRWFGGGGDRAQRGKAAAH